MWGGMTGGTRDNTWMKLMGIVHTGGGGRTHGQTHAGVAGTERNAES